MTLTNTGSWLLSNDPTQGIDTNSVPQSTVNQNLFDYTTQVANGSKYKEPVLAIAIVNQPISTSAPFDADGVIIPLNGRVFLGFQTSPAENGIYVLTNTGLVRGDSSNTWDECVGSVFQVTGGDTYGGSQVRLTINSGGTLGVTPITWFDSAESSINATNISLTNATNQIVLGSGANTITLNGEVGSTGNHVMTIPGATCTAAQPITATTGQYITSMDGSGVFTKAGLPSNIPIMDTADNVKPDNLWYAGLESIAWQFGTGDGVVTSTRKGSWANPQTSWSVLNTPSSGPRPLNVANFYGIPTSTPGAIISGLDCTYNFSYAYNTQATIATDDYNCVFNRLQIDAGNYTINNSANYVYEDLYIGGPGVLSIALSTSGNYSGFINFDPSTFGQTIRIGSSNSQSITFDASGGTFYGQTFVKDNPANENTHSLYFQNGFQNTITGNIGQSIFCNNEQNIAIDNSGDSVGTMLVTITNSTIQDIFLNPAGSYLVTGTQIPNVPYGIAGAGGFHGAGYVNSTNPPVASSIAIPVSNGATPSFVIPDSVIYGGTTIFECNTDNVVKTSLTFDFTNLGKRSDGKFVHVTTCHVLLTGVDPSNLTTAGISITRPAGIDRNSALAAATQMGAGMRLHFTLQTLDQDNMYVF